MAMNAQDLMGQLNQPAQPQMTPEAALAAVRGAPPQAYSPQDALQRIRQPAPMPPQSAPTAGPMEFPLPPEEQNPALSLNTPATQPSSNPEQAAFVQSQMAAGDQTASDLVPSVDKNDQEIFQVMQKINRLRSYLGSLMGTK